MNDFIAKLIALRNGAVDTAKGTLHNMSNVREREQQMLDAERARNADLIGKNFGTPDNYRKFLADQPPLPETPGQKLGNFLERLIQLRSGAKN